MLKRRFLLLLTMTLIASCHGTVVPIDTACSWVKPIDTNKADRASMSRSVKQQIVIHNQLYDSHCGQNE